MHEFSEYPKKAANGRDMYWACCVSTIGPTCGHKALPQDDSMTLYPRTEPLNVNMPKTYFGRKPEDLTHGLGWVRACPIYQVPSSPGSTRPEVGEYAFSCYVVETFGNDMVKVRFDWDGVPGQREQIVYPHEIHAPKCQCRACKTDHIYNVD